MYQTSGLPAITGPSHAPSWAKRPSAVRLRGVEVGANGSISTTQPSVGHVAVVVAAVADAPSFIAFQRPTCCRPCRA